MGGLLYRGCLEISVLYGIHVSFRNAESCFKRRLLAICQKPFLKRGQTPQKTCHLQSQMTPIQALPIVWKT